MNKRRCLKVTFLCWLTVFLMLSFAAGVKAQPSGTETPACANINTATMLHQYDDGSGGTVEQAQSLFWSPDGKQIAVWLQRIDSTKVVTDPTNWLQVWDVAEGKLSADLEFDQYTYPTDIVWSADSSKVAVAFSNHVRIWAGGSDWSPTLFEIDDFDRFEQVIWSADGSQLFTNDFISPNPAPKGIYGFGNVIRRWDVATGKLLDESPAFDQAFLTTDGVQAIIISHADNRLSVRTANDDHILWSLPGVYLAGGIFTEQVQRVATIKIEARNVDISVWDIPTNRKLLDLTGEYFPAVTFSPNGRFLQTRLNM
ncbi:MAG: WD40 repeat domain-containing protein, partial [Chloroflexota bacterium]